MVAVGERRAEQIDACGPDILDSRSHLYPDSLRTMGWDVGASGMELVLAPDLPTFIERYLGDDVTNFLGAHGLSVDDVGAWVSHPGGPKIIEAITAALDLPDDALELTWRSLSDVGNLSSAIGVARAARHDRQTAAEGQPRAADGDGSRILLRTRVAALALR